jgi:hypothetical protein
VTCSRCGEPFERPDISQGRRSHARYCDACRPLAQWPKKRHVIPEGMVDLRSSGTRSNVPLPPDAIQCAICGGHFITLARHLKKHGTTAREYRKTYGGPTVSPSYGKDRAEVVLEHVWGRTEARWTRERIIVALQAEMRAGRYPHARRPASRRRPSPERMKQVFGSHSAALEAAGITPRDTVENGRRKRVTRPAPPSWIEAYERGDRMKDIAKHAGVSVDQVRKRLRVAGVTIRPTGRPKKLA